MKAGKLLGIFFVCILTSCFFINDVPLARTFEDSDEPQIPNVTFGLERYFETKTLGGVPDPDVWPIKLRAFAYSKKYNMLSWVKGTLRPSTEDAFICYGLVFTLIVGLENGDFLAVAYIWEYWKYAVPYYPYEANLKECHIAVEKQLSGVKTLIYLDKDVPTPIVLRALTKPTEFTICYSYTGKEWYLLVDGLLTYTTPASGRREDPCRGYCGGISACAQNSMKNTFSDIWLAYYSGGLVTSRWSNPVKFTEEPYDIEIAKGSFDAPVDFETNGGVGVVLGGGGRSGGIPIKTM